MNTSLLLKGFYGSPLQVEKEADFYSTIVGGPTGPNSSDEVKTTGPYLHYYPGFYIDGSLVVASATASTSRQTTVTSSVISDSITEYIIRSTLTVGYELTRSALVPVVPTPVGDRPLKTTIATAYYSTGGSSYSFELTDPDESIISEHTEEVTIGSYYTSGVFRLVTPKSAGADMQSGQFSHTEIRTIRVYQGPKALNSLRFEHSVPVLRDPGTTNPLFDPDKEHYLDSNQDGTPEQKHPVLYSAGSIPTVDATFKFQQGATGQYLIQGIATGGFYFEGIGSISNGMLSVQGMQAKINFGAVEVKSFGPQVKKYDDFAIEWTLTPSGGGTPVPGGTSHNTLYVSAAQSLSPHPFESVVYLAIANSLGGSAAFPQLIIDAIWSDFSDREVRRIDGNLLFYYGNPATSEPENNRVVTTEGLLQTGNGQCGSWVQFFLDCLAVNGIAGGLHVRVDPINSLEEMLVKDYDFLGAGHSGVGAYPFLFLSEVENIANGTVIKPSDVVDRDGIEGQGTDRPLSKFQNHQLALIGGRYYDPSYGVSYGSLAEMEARSIAGFVLAYPKDVLLVEAIVGDVDDLANHNVYIGRAIVARKEDVTRADLQVAYAFPYPLAPSTGLIASSGLSSNAVESGSRNNASIVDPEGNPERGDTSSVVGVYDYIYAAATSFKSVRMYLSATRANPTAMVALVEKVPIRSVTPPSMETGRARSGRSLWENSGETSARDTVFYALEEQWRIEPLFRKSLHSCVGA